MEKKYKRLSVEFPADEYVFLKMACAKEGVTIKDFVTTAVKMYIEDYESKLDVLAMKKALSEEDLNVAIPWEEAEKMLGWDKL